MLQERLRVLHAAVAFKEEWASLGLGLFVKNLENVQGDERDCIMISTTFGKPKGASVVRQNFGPISREGGWRRLNVLFTRAKKSVAVFSSMRPEDIVIDEKTPEGTRALRNYLEFARTGVMPIERETGLPPDSDFEIAVIDILQLKGYDCTPQLGVAGFRIDIAIKHPEHKSGYLAAIECDGAAYHSGISVRDRDRIRQEVLEGLGWRGRIWRIWSTDWFRNPIAETDRLLQFLDALKRQPIPDEYLAFESAGDVDDTGPSVGSSVLTPAGMFEQAAEDMVFEDAGGDLEVEVGDLISYSPIETPDQLISVRLTFRQTNPALGLVSEGTPLGAVLMGSMVGDRVILRVPSKAPQTFIIHSIKRSLQEAAQ
jgi:very-short-patch-repair endonuclease